MRVLIVEDHPPMRQLLRAVIADLADGITECSNGAEAVAAYTTQQFQHEDWVLMDLEMPGLDGLEATRRLHAAFPDARILIVTQFGDEHWRAAAAAAGASGYVLKENLLELRGWLQPERAQATNNPSDLPTAEKGSTP